MVRRSIGADGNPRGYRQLLGAMKAEGYECVSFKTIDPGKRHVIMRHDIDLTLDLAERMAEIEAEEGWVATYFVLLSSEFYNPSSKAGRRALRVILGLGHEIGLHFDTSVHGEAADVETAAIRECEQLEGIICRSVDITACHRPSATKPAFVGKPGLFAGRAHAYEPRFFSDIGYVSDSSGDWACGHPLDHACVSQGRGLQLLTHPYLWMQDNLSFRDDKIARALKTRASALQCAARDQFRGLRLH